MAVNALSIRTRLTLWYVALLAILLVGFSAALYVLVARALYQQVDDTLIASAGQITISSATTANVPASVTTFVVDPATVNLVRAGEAGAADVFTGTQFIGLAQPIAIELGNVAWNTQPATTTQFTTISQDGQTFRVYNASSNADGTVQVVSSLAPVQRTLQELALALGLVVPITLGVAAFGGMWFSRRALAPVDHITRAAQELSAHDLHRRLQLQLPDDEVGRLARTFDNMLARLDDAFQREREFTSNASHELRTPLTVMRGEIQVALQRTRTPHEYAGVLQTLDGDVARMSETVNDLLLLARADAQHLPTECETLNAALILETVHAAWTNVAAPKHIAIEIDAPATLEFLGNEPYCVRALGNLVENALKFSPAQTTIRLRAARENDFVALSVCDQGIGIPPSQLPYVFERFYRANDGRTPGTGLGLPLARALLAAQGGALQIESVENQGTTATARMRVL